MKKIRLTGDFDGEKFAKRYRLTTNEFYVSSGLLHFPDRLPDQPTLEAPDVVTPVVRPDAEIERLKADAATDADVKRILKWMANTSRI